MVNSANYSKIVRALGFLDHKGYIVSPQVFGMDNSYTRHTDLAYYIISFIQGITFNDSTMDYIDDLADQVTEVLDIYFCPDAAPLEDNTTEIVW